MKCQEFDAYVTMPDVDQCVVIDDRVHILPLDEPVSVDSIKITAEYPEGFPYIRILIEGSNREIHLVMEPDQAREFAGEILFVAKHLSVEEKVKRAKCDMRR